MRERLVHRGPDSRGLWSGPSGRCLLAHTRLAVLDPTSAGNQPMVTKDGRFGVVFNGEIYNFKELRKEMERSGERFGSGTDTEVVLRLYRRKGPGMVDVLRGMFALAVWDDAEGTCFLARDPLGIKPLYTAVSEGDFLFASELRALLASGRVRPRLDAAACCGYLRTGFVAEPRTMAEGVRCLEPGHSMLWRDGRADVRRFWRMDFTPEDLPPQETAAKVRGALEESVGRHLQSDVPWGIFLSGGLDSTVLLALAAGRTSGPVRTYSAVFEERDWDEGAAARRTAKAFGARHREFLLTAGAARGMLEEYFDAVDQPSADGFNVFCLSRLAARDGIKVALSGLGSDEVFGGYPTFGRMPRLLRLSETLGRFGKLRGRLGHWLDRRGMPPKLRRLGSFLEGEADFGQAYLCLRGIFSRGEVRSIFRRLTGTIEQ